MRRTVTTPSGDALDIAPAREQDCEELFALANEPEVRAQSFSSRPIAWDEHRAWLARKLDDPRCHLWLARVDGRLAGQVRFDVAGREAIVGIATSAAFRRKGVGLALLREGATMAFDACPALETVCALIKPENEASVALFARAGFSPYGPGEVEGARALEYRLGRP